MEKNKFLYLLLIASFSGILLGISWPPQQFTFLIFFSFIPFLYIVDELNNDSVKHSNFKLFILSLIAFLIWNSITLWWLSKATFAGAASALFGNALLMTIPILLYQQIKKHVASKVGYIALITFWLSFEYIQLNWDLAWPWLNLGNVFAMQPSWIQWFEYTGVLGGTLWIWLINISLYRLITYLFQYNKGVISSIKLYNRILFLFLVLVIPISISYLINPEKGVELKLNAVIVQPNIDPYKDKFREGAFENQLKTLIHLSDSLTDSNTIIIVWPETAISISLDESNINSEPSIQSIRQFLRKHPQAKIISGLDSYHFFEEKEELTSTARKFENRFYDSYNSAIMLDTSIKFDLYHKSKLVPGVEKMPYPKIFGFLEKLTINLGGTSGSLGEQKEASVFKVNDSLTIAPIICYESVFGEYLGNFVNKGADLMVIMTNDGWWGTSNGYKQHVNYAVLRAIELRKFIVRAANTGISCFIDPSGQIIQQTPFWVSTSSKHKLQITKQQTFYAKNGDFIGRIGLFASFIFIFLLISKKISGKISKK